MKLDGVESEEQVDTCMCSRRKVPCCNESVGELMPRTMERKNKPVRPIYKTISLMHNAKQKNCLQNALQRITTPSLTNRKDSVARCFPQQNPCQQSDAIPRPFPSILSAHPKQNQYVKLGFISTHSTPPTDPPSAPRYHYLAAAVAAGSS